jgi:membrane protease YdiL (CAAX protease family)
MKNKKLQYIHFILGCILLFITLEILSGITVSFFNIDTYLWNFSFQTAINIVLVFVLMIFLSRYYNISWDLNELIIKSNYFKQILLYLVLYFGLTGFLFIVFGFSFDLKKFKGIELFQFSFYLFFAAMLEELLYRYVLLNKNFRENISIYVMVITSSIIFALVHITNGNMTYVRFIELFLAGLVFSVLYLRFKNLWVPILFHFFTNVYWVFLLGFMHIDFIYHGILIANGKPLYLLTMIDILGPLFMLMILWIKPIKRFFRAKLAV